MNKVIDFVINAYLKVVFTFLYLIGFSDHVPFSLSMPDFPKKFELSSCSGVRQSNTCTSEKVVLMHVGKCDTKCDYRWDMILSTRQVTRTYAEAFPGLAKKTCSAPLTQPRP